MLEELQRLAAEGDSPHARQIRADLERAGMHVDGSVQHVNRELYDPETCQKLPGRYWHMCIYQSWRSKHNVKDKTMADSAATGGVDAKTGQGTKGYAKAGGGQKVGEMEQDCLLLLATTNLMYEMYLSQSDGTVGRALLQGLRPARHRPRRHPLQALVIALSCRVLRRRCG